MSQFVCKTCNIPIDAETARNVGSWKFCPACFDKLLSSDSDTSSEPTVESESFPRTDGSATPLVGIERAQPAPTIEPKRICGICDVIVQPKQYRTIGQTLICDACFTDLLPVEELTAPVAVPKPAVKPVPRPPNSMSQSDVNLVESFSRSSSTESLTCAACSKGIPALAAGKTHEGRLFCPDCYSKLEIEKPAVAPVETQKKPSIVSETPRAKEEGSPNELFLTCDCCQKVITPDVAVIRSGFYICVPCENYDSAGALQVAQRRHAATFEKNRARFQVD
ncbi:MAG: hypothetical protein VYC39_07000 [Myxococcota bacterium]|nr:hypothetical protein [Myxococcota bacterium]